jgi:hypothetical protein
MVNVALERPTRSYSTGADSLPSSAFVDGLYEMEARFFTASDDGPVIVPNDIAASSSSNVVGGVFQEDTTFLNLKCSKTKRLDLAITHAPSKAACRSACAAVALCNYFSYAVSSGQDAGWCAGCSSESDLVNGKAEDNARVGAIDTFASGDSVTAMPFGTITLKGVDWQSPLVQEERFCRSEYDAVEGTNDIEKSESCRVAGGICFPTESLSDCQTSCEIIGSACRGVSYGSFQYERIGSGYCSDVVHLPEGSYPAHLATGGSSFVPATETSGPSSVSALQDNGTFSQKDVADVEWNIHVQYSTSSLLRFSSASYAISSFLHYSFFFNVYEYTLRITLSVHFFMQIQFRNVRIDVSMPIRILISFP